MQTKLFFCAGIFACGTVFSQNVGVNNDGSAPETNVMLDVKGSNAAATNGTQNIFQIKSNDASTDALKLRLGLGTNSTATSRYGLIEVPDYVGNAVSAYRPLALQPSGGNVGIGTSAPSSLLEIKGAGASPDMLRLTSTSGRPVFTIGTAAGNANGPVIGIGRQGTAEFAIYLYNGASKLAISDASTGNDAFSIMGGKTTVGNGSGISGANSLNVYGNMSIGTTYYNAAATANGLLVEGIVGLGTMTPTNRLHIIYSNNSSDGIFMQNQNAGTGAYTRIALNNDGGNEAGLLFNSTTNTNYAGPNGLAVGTYVGGGDLRLYTVNAPRMTIDQSGRVGIATTSPSFALDVNGTGRFVSDLRADTKLVLNGDATNYYIGAGIGNGYVQKTWDEIRFQFNGGGSDISFKNGAIGIGTNVPSEKLEVCGNLKVIGTINASSTINASQAISCSSDLRFKKNIRPLQNSLENILSLRGVNYDWRVNEFPEKNFSEGNQVGFIAQELEKVYPEMVFTDKDGYKSVDYSRLTPVLVEAIKAQQKEIDELKSMVSILVQQNAEAKK